MRGSETPKHDTATTRYIHVMYTGIRKKQIKHHELDPNQRPPNP